jgi:hypothetical protein
VPYVLVHGDIGVHVRQPFQSRLCHDSVLCDRGCFVIALPYPRFLHGDDDERSSLFKMIPRIAEGSWVVKQSVGTTPVIMGRKLKTSYHITPKYVEVAVDVGSSSTAQYVTGMVSSKGVCVGLG